MYPLYSSSSVFLFLYIFPCAVMCCVTHLSSFKIVLCVTYGHCIVSAFSLSCVVHIM